MQDYEFWQRRLAGEDVGLPSRDVQCGFYRGYTREGVDVAIAIWRGKDGQMRAKYGRDGAVIIPDETWAEMRFARSCKHPITQAMYDSYMAGEPLHPEPPKARKPRQPKAAPEAAEPEPAFVNPNPKLRPADPVVRERREVAPLADRFTIKGYAALDNEDGPDRYAMFVRPKGANLTDTVVVTYGESEDVAHDKAEAWLDAEQAKLDLEKANIDKRVSARRASREGAKPAPEADKGDDEDL